MQTLRATSDTLYRDMVLDALEGTVDQLPDLIAKSSQPTTVKTRLFEREETVAKADPEPRVQLTIGGFLNSQLEVIDGLVEEFGAPSRSALVNAALDAFLPTS
ncbi:hypothetical protein [Nocardioides sp.]|uniref:hypothetical protein n=1 Tax=Nocardioides sp. TaxID=35761 RepID=UPI0027360079|nr:hypothetical protein [Nocardioides sp.]MDP3893622.1 hypothetical protein [Nocardioides sp.]